MKTCLLRGTVLHGLQDLVLGDVGRQHQVPVGIAREDVFASLIV